MSITICDSIMGSGKTSAAINYIINNRNKRFIYIGDRDGKLRCAQLTFALSPNPFP